MTLLLVGLLCFLLGFWFGWHICVASGIVDTITKDPALMDYIRKRLYKND